MQIAIITNQTPLNYGANLQAYALQTYLEKLGCNVEIINYAPDFYTEELSLMYIGRNSCRRNILFGLFYILYKLPSRLKRRWIFAKFQKKFLNLTPKKYKSYDELLGYPPKADVYICGSDQIWNTHGTRGYNPAFYLEFVEDCSKRFSYAASMSLDTPITERVKRDVFPMINKLKHVSVRESVTAEIIQPYIQKKVYQVLDPVFLLNSEDWSTLELDKKKLHKQYILIYPMGDASNVLKNATILANKTKLPIFCISASKKRFHGVSKCFNCSIGLFLQLFSNASYIVTNSFHGTSFSIIYKKTFWTCEIGNNNHRIVSLLKLLGLEDRYIDKDSLLDLQTININYTNSLSHIDNAIKNSKDYLDKIIKRPN